jgi:dolichol-phosphate mannosyltransferase
MGYKIGLELMVTCQPARIEEVPITFHLRRHGESKLSMRQRFEYLEHVARL